jgi:hypothetical protein
MTIEARSVRDLVGELADDAAALAELREFERALNELWSALSSLVASARGTAEAIRLMNELGRTSPEALGVLVERVARLDARSWQLLLAFGELCRGVRGWAVAPRVEGQRHSVLATPVPIDP